MKVTNANSPRQTWNTMFSGVLIIVGVVAVVVAGMWYFHMRREYSKRTHCVSNLVHIGIAKLGWQMDNGVKDGEPVSVAELNNSYLLQPFSLYRCHKGGTYVIGKTGEYPTCTYTNVTYTYYFDAKAFKLRRSAWTHEFGLR